METHVHADDVVLFKVVQAPSRTCLRQQLPPLYYLHNLASEGNDASLVSCLESQCSGQSNRAGLALGRLFAAVRSLAGRRVLLATSGYYYKKEKPRRDKRT
ncbi:hypothetical protein MRX96_030723 [Rhipicephalus microplus]